MKKGREREGERTHNVGAAHNGQRRREREPEDQLPKADEINKMRVNAAGHRLQRIT